MQIPPHSQPNYLPLHLVNSGHRQTAPFGLGLPASYGSTSIAVDWFVPWNSLFYSRSVTLSDRTSLLLSCTIKKLREMTCSLQMNNSASSPGWLISTVVRYIDTILYILEARRPSGRASHSRARGWGFDPHSGRSFVSLSKIHLPPKSPCHTQEVVAPSRHD